jgi:hypothetical protein
MKQLLSLFLFLLPCLAWAQYPSNGNQKITLGEQTTADGLIYRGVIGDTALITPLSDTSAYIILDTVNHRFYNYNRATNVWSVAGGGTAVTTFSAGTTGLTPSTATSGAVTLGGTLAVANGGTGADMSSLPNNYLVRKNSSGVFDTAAIYEAGGNVGIGTASPRYKLDINTGSDTVRINGTTGDRLLLFSSGNNSGINGLNFSSDIYPGLTFDSRLTTLGAVISKGRLMINSIAGGYGSGSLAGATTLQSDNTLQFSTGGFDIRLTISSNGEVTINNLAGINDVGADANGKLQAATSDMNLKNTIENSPFGLNEILLLNPVTFLYNDTDRKIDSDVKEVGFIAQDVFDIIPNAVSSTGTGDLQLDYRAITATLTKAIQEQQALIKALEQRIINLENK